jgi:NAD(P)-dependent dehydrogenase (short-subunit alcohol dehydrogenase family)
VSQEADLERLADAAVSTYGSLGVWCSNAGDQGLGGPAALACLYAWYSPSVCVCNDTWIQTAAALTLEARLVAAAPGWVARSRVAVGLYLAISTQ